MWISSLFIHISVKPLGWLLLQTEFKYVNSLTHFTKTYIGNVTNFCCHYKRKACRVTTKYISILNFMLNSPECLTLHTYSTKQSTFDFSDLQLQPYSNSNQVYIIREVLTTPKGGSGKGGVCACGGGVQIMHSFTYNYICFSSVIKIWFSNHNS